MDELIKKIDFSAGTLKTDSRQIDKGDIFVAIKGTACDGHDHILEAIEKGAKSVLCQKWPSGLNPDNSNKLIIVDNTREVLGDIARQVFNEPSNDLSIYGIRKLRLAGWFGCVLHHLPL